MERRVEQVTKPNGHRKYVLYEGDAVIAELPSVTTVLGAMPKGGLEWWGFKLGLAAAQDLGYGDLMDLEEFYTLAKQTRHAPHRALKWAASRGTDVHELAEILLREGRLANLPAGTNADEGYVDALVKWHEDAGVADWTMIAVEQSLYSTRHLFAGTTDFIALRPDGVYVVGDFKTSKDIYESHLLQAAAYAYAANEMGFIPDGAQVEQQVIRVGLDGEYAVKRSPATIDDFLAVKSVWTMLKDLKSRGKRK